MSLNDVVLIICCISVARAIMGALAKDYKDYRIKMIALDLCFVLSAILQLLGGRGQ